MSDTVSPAAPIAASEDVAPAPLARNVVTEAVGTTLVMLAGPGLLTLTGVAASDLAVALSFGLAVAISIGVIGAVANPVFTLALLVVREVSPRGGDRCDRAGRQRWRRAQSGEGDRFGRLR